MGEAASTEQTYDFSISSANTWEQKTWDISSIATTSRDATQYFAFKITNADSAFTLYFDDIQAAETPTVISPSNCIIDQGSNNTTFTLKWIDNSDNEEGFKIYKNGSLLTTVGAGVTGYPDSAITAGNTYAYKAFAYLTDSGTQITSPVCDFSILQPDRNSFKMEGLKIN